MADRTEKMTIPFLRMTATELRRIAAVAPEIAARLYDIAAKADAEADEIAAQFKPGRAAKNAGKG